MSDLEAWAEQALTHAAETVKAAAAAARAAGVTEPHLADFVRHPHRNADAATAFLGADARQARAALERLAQASLALSETIRAVDAAHLRPSMLIESRRRSAELLAGRLAEGLR